MLSIYLIVFPAYTALHQSTRHWFSGLHYKSVDALIFPQEESGWTNIVMGAPTMHYHVHWMNVSIYIIAE